MERDGLRLSSAMLKIQWDHAPLPLRLLGNMKSYLFFKRTSIYCARTVLKIVSLIYFMVSEINV